jgi:hypothetical protein
MPHVKNGRKRICGGTKVMTSRVVSERMKETVSKNVKDRSREEKRKQPRQNKPNKKKESDDAEQLKPLASI